MVDKMKTYFETPFELSDGRILLFRTDREIVTEPFIPFDADIMTKKEYVSRLEDHGR